MQVGVAFPADPQPAEVVQPSECAFHDPALTAEPGTMLGASARDPVLQTTRSELATVLVVVIATIGDHSLGALSRSPPLAFDRSGPVDERKELGDVVAVPAGQRDGQRHAARVDVQMVF